MNSLKLEIVLATNSVYPYHLHNVAILSLPYGGTYHFRYERQYFQLSCADQLKGLRGKLGILVLRDFERATFIPLRTFRVLDVDDCGDLVFLDLQFLNFIEYAASRSELDAELPEQTSDALLKEREKYSDGLASQLELFKIENGKNQHLAKLILPGASQYMAKIAVTKSTEGGEFAHDWLNVVTALGGMKAYEKVCFYLVCIVADLNNGKTAVRFSNQRRSGLILRTGRVYQIRVYQVMADRSVPAKPEFNMNLEYVEAHVAPLQSKILVDGAYDRLSFVMSVLAQQREKSESELLFTCAQAVPNPADSSNSTSIPSTPVQLQIKWPRFSRFTKWVIYPVLFVLGSGLFVLADHVQNWLSLSENGKYVIQLIGLAFLAVGGRTWGFLTGSVKSGPPTPPSTRGGTGD